MQNPPQKSLLGPVFLALSTLLILATQPLFAQQSYVGRYDLYAGYTNLDSPALGLNENGFHLQAGVNPKTWYSLGFDYSRSTGDLILTPSELTTLDQEAIAGALQLYGPAFGLSSSYQLAVPAHSLTQTFAAGPQYEFRHFKKTTLFLRPSIGAIRERATPHPTDAFSTLIVSQLAPSGTKLDWVAFYGVGGGIDYTVTQHFGIRAQFDYVHDHLFDDLLANGRNTVRLSIGPSFRFGKNIAK
ncbi:hypothetical protein [Granulicella arctica]|uniref:Outer membrane protein beta-barrel domain-containing protein n=1 Tax=Granulicella arctica TaxID=940613 RepID=A0A7Y9TFD1_9BACT|nr:hypothetical protein [Granulicella arctica]NYF78626.1 hypothetical protein [Granulicella arctica]